MADPYTTLGVEQTATTDDIKRAYRKLSHQYHPDKKTGDEEKFKEVNAAYQVLGDDKKRSQYDQFGSTFEDAGSQGGPPAGFGGFDVNFEDLGINDVFEQFFGRGQARARQSRGEDIGIDLSISFRESATGVTREVTTRLPQACSRCHGNAAEPGTPISECATCSGSGQVSTTRQTMLGTFAQTSVCPECKGEGKKAEKACTQCRGEGREVSDQTLEVEVPAGIADGQAIRLSGKGSAAQRGGITGDLFIKIHVDSDETLRRDGDDVRSIESISFVDAALGTNKSVTTLTGTHELEIPAGTQPDTEFNLADKGFPRLQGGGTGDQRVTIEVVIPQKLSKPQRQALEAFRQAKGKKSLF